MRHQKGSNMLDFQGLVLFLGAVTLLLLSPGPSMMFVVSHGFKYGWRGGIAAAMGIGLADLALTFLTAVGITGLIAAWPPSFDLIRYVGAVYLLWMAWKALRPNGSASPTETALTPLKSVLLRATLNSLLNPKALLFFIVFLPQFVVPARGHITEQLFVLGCLLTVLAFAFHAVLGAFGGSIGRAMAKPGRYSRLGDWGLAGVFSLLAARLIIMQRPT